MMLLVQWSEETIEDKLRVATEEQFDNAAS